MTDVHHDPSVPATVHRFPWRRKRCAVCSRPMAGLVRDDEPRYHSHVCGQVAQPDKTITLRGGGGGS